jgi:Uma2 family endonuclease
MITRVFPYGYEREVSPLCRCAALGGTLACMSPPAPRHRYTFAEYLELEEMAGVRHEYYDGEIYAMAGGTPEHAAMAGAITAIIGRKLSSGPCRVYSSDLRVRVLATGLSTYPDVSVVCGRSERDPESPTHITNPCVLVEVLSPATAEYDRGEKLQHYQCIPSLRAVVLVDYQSTRIEVWRRNGEQWQQETHGAGELVPLEEIDCALPMDEVYAAARDA